MASRLLELGTGNSKQTELFLEMSESEILCFIHFYLETFDLAPVSCVQNATPISLATSPQPHLLGAVLG
jgi:hypothetical protein